MNSFIQKHQDILEQNEQFCIQNNHVLFLCNLTSPEGITAVHAFVQSEYGRKCGAKPPQPPFSSDLFYFTAPFDLLSENAPAAYNFRPDVLNVIAYEPDQQLWRNHYLLKGTLGKYFIRDDAGQGKTNPN